MVTVIFYEKPGCVNNARQKKILTRSGHKVISFNLLNEPWSASRLKRFFQKLPKAEWFNSSAPQIKSGEINPERIGVEQALSSMIENPILIRRPLMQVHDQYMAGFDVKSVDQWIGINFSPEDPDVETCRQHETIDTK